MFLCNCPSWYFKNSFYNYFFLGSNHLYLFINPFATDVDSNLQNDMTWEFAQKEIAKASGYSAAMLNGLTKGMKKKQSFHFCPVNTNL